MTGRLLAAGFSTRHIAASARRAGYGVVAVDHFCDLDLVREADACIRFETLEEPARPGGRCRAHVGIDGFIAGSGAETLVLPVPLLGTPPATAARFLDKGETQSFFEGLGVRVPRRLAPGHVSGYGQAASRLGRLAERGDRVRRRARRLDGLFPDPLPPPGG